MTNTYRNKVLKEKLSLSIIQEIYNTKGHGGKYSLTEIDQMEE